MTLSIIAVFIITYMLPNLVLILIDLKSISPEKIKSLNLYLKPIINILWTFGPSVNIVLYCNFNKKFRKALSYMFGFEKEKPLQSHRRSATRTPVSLHRSVNTELKQKLNSYPTTRV